MPKRSNITCTYGVKKSGGCKKKPGPKPGPKLGARRTSRRRTSRRRTSRRRTSRRRSSRRRTSRRRTSRRRSSRRKNTYMTVSRCKSALKEKIRINTREYNNGKYANRKQAIAVAYSQIKKNYPQCKHKV